MSGGTYGSREFDEDEVTVNTINEYGLMSGQNLPNHSTSLAGKGRFVKTMNTVPPVFRTKQQAYRFIAFLEVMADVLPDELGSHTLEEVREAVRNV